MQLIGCQFDIAWEDKPANFDRVRGLFEKFKVEPGALIVLPEMFSTGFSMNVASILEPPQGPAHQFISQLARDTGAFVMGGIATAGSDGRGRNDAVVFDPMGKEILRYCKLHPFSPGGEDKYYARGDTSCSFTWGPCRVIPQVCYDLRFPEVFRQETRRGAQLFVVIANWPIARDAHWQALLRARAIENQAYVIGVNRAGNDPKFAYAGHSLILDPRGETLAAAESSSQLIEARIDIDSLLEYRSQFPVLQDMRAEYFAEP